MIGALVRVVFNRLGGYGGGVDAAVDRGLLRTARIGSDASVGSTPVKTGALVGTKRAEMVGRGQARVYWPAHYAAYQEFGTSRGVPARNFATTGFDTAVAAAPGIMAEEVGRVFR